MMIENSSLTKLCQLILISTNHNNIRKTSSKKTALIVRKRLLDFKQRQFVNS